MRALLVLAIHAGAPAAASPVFIGDGRQLLLSNLPGTGCHVSDTIFLPAAPFAAFDESHSFSDSIGGAVAASQSSVVGAGGMSGSGAVDNTTGTSHFCADSAFSVTFDLSSAHVYDFAGTLVTRDGEAFATFALTGGGDEFDHLVYGLDSQEFVESGVLLPGRWTLSAFVASGAGSGSSFTFEFQLVPEPACTALLALAAASLPVSGRLRRRAPSARRMSAHVPREQQHAQGDG